MEFSLDVSRCGKSPGDSRFSLRTTLLSGKKVRTSSLLRKVERGMPVRLSTRSICRSPSQACQMRALDRAPAAEETTKVPA